MENVLSLDDAIKSLVRSQVGFSDTAAHFILGLFFGLSYAGKVGWRSATPSFCSSAIPRFKSGPSSKSCPHREIPCGTLNVASPFASPVVNLPAPKEAGVRVATSSNPERRCRQGWPVKFEATSIGPVMNGPISASTPDIISPKACITR